MPSALNLPELACRGSLKKLIEIRAAIERDASELAAMRYDFRAGLDAPLEPRDAFISRCKGWMAACLRDVDSAWRCWVAQETDSLIGNVWLRLIDKLPNPVAEPEAHGYVSNLYVVPQRRDQGVGGRLLNAAVEWCASRRVDWVILWPTPASRTLYARRGFKTTEDIMALTLRR